MQFFHLVKGGISGLASHLTDNTGKVDKEIEKEFGIKENQKCLKHFNCAYESGIILQGKMYVYEDRVCFFSHFNKYNLVGFYKTYVVILYEDIQEIKKAKRLIFNNTIEISLNKNKEVHAFTSFMSRKKAYNILQN